MRRSLLLAIALAACDPGVPPGVPAIPERDPPFATFLDLHAGVIARTCSPNPGVCHAADSYPDLSTAATALLAIASPCNLSTPEPTRGFDACERRADHVVAEDIDSELAWIEELGDALYTVEMRDAAPATGRFDVVFTRDGNTIFAVREDDRIHGFRLAIDTIEGSRTATVGVYLDNQFLGFLYGGATRIVIPGDPNKNGIFGADGSEHARVIEPGHLDKSYLWGRITGTMPGTRMPLANQPLSAEEYVAIACWIEGLAKTESPAAEDPIDYDACAFAKSPIDYSMQ